MRRTVTDAIRRGFDNALANWPLLLFRIAEAIVTGLIVIATIFVTIIPVLVSAGLSMSQFNTEKPQDLAEAFLNFLVYDWWIVLYVLFVVTVVGFVLMVLHSFVMGGIARVLVDGDRAGGDGKVRARFNVFSAERWIEGGKEMCWPLFWIYNIAYGIGVLVMLIPMLIFFAIVMATLRPFPPIAIFSGCVGILITGAIGIVSIVLCTIWAQKAIIVSAARRMNGRDALRVGWQEFRADFGRHFVVAILMLMITFGVSQAFNSFSMIFSTFQPSPHDIASAIRSLFFPVRIAFSFIGGFITSAVGLWFLGSFAAITESK